MTIDDLTIGEAKQLASLFQQNKSKSSLYDGYVGKYVIVRSRNEGINAGIVKAADETGVVLSQARRIWYHKPKDTSLAWYEGVAVSGLSDDSKVSTPVEEKAIIEDYSIVLCSNESKLSISGKKAHAQS